MKALWKVFAYYYNQSLFLRVLFVAGIFVLLIPVSILLLALSPYNREEAAFPLLMLPFVISFGIPYLFAPSAARRLLACPHTSLIPHFHLYVGLSLLVFTLLIVAYPVLVGLAVIDGSVVPLGVVLFAGASLYCAVVQIFLTLPVNPQLLSFLSFAIAIFMIRYGESLLHWGLTDIGLILIPALCCIGWSLALHRLTRCHHFHLNRQAAASFRQNFWGSAENWPMDNSPRKLAKIATPTGTLLLGHPDALGNRLFRTVVLIVAIPLTNVIILYSLGMFDGDSNLQFTQFAVIMMIAITMAISQQSTEMVARARWLWLRCGGNRKNLWRLVENSMLKEQFLAHGLIFIIIAILLKLSDIPLIHYMSFVSIVSGGLFMAYCGIFCRINASPVMGYMAVLIGGPAFFITTAMGLFSGNYFPALITQLMLAAIALVFRTIVHRQFQTIDWLQVKPVKRPGRHFLSQAKGSLGS